MEWSDLRIFLAIARAGTLAGAAKRIGQTQPTMGRRLKTLEAAVGDALFQRTREGFVLTPEGAVMLAHAERIEEEVLGLERKLSGRDAGLEGLIRISSSDWFGVHMLTPVFANFSKKHPGVTIELITDARLFSLSRREADMVFRIRPFEEADIVQRKLMHMPYGLYAARSARIPRNHQGQGLALVTMDTAFGGLPDVTWLQRMLPHAHTVFGSNNREAQARMCAAGIGLAVLPRPLGDATPGLKLLDLGEAPPGRDVWVGYHRDLRRLARLKALLDMAVDMLGT
ncbi:LysR family transcriptional regulator [Polaromonas sp.]|uniref:LysR family transcriptional regulator n=1 Tax=Polaromonas sp. TaxID=1869339 RepID=UPI0024897AD3|nr:LysR family transcriptional regulator [Polaromonas sp.]MDI1273275.1 LysR family transcriptional regulator [Polaromonas sp.]